MIFKTASPISPDVEITIDSVMVNYLSLQRISLEKEENNHDSMVLDFAGVAPETIYDYIDKPIKLSITFPNLGGTSFVGYVVFAEPVSATKDGLVNLSPFQITRFYCFGASYVMRSKNSQAWDNLSLPEIALSLADKYKFSVTVPNNPYRFPRLVQSNESDWASLVSVCDTLGYSVGMDGTTLNIWDPFKALGRRTSFAVLKTLKGSNNSPTPDVGQILKFEGRIGRVTTSGGRTPDRMIVLDKDSNVFEVGGTLTESSTMGIAVQSRFKNLLAMNSDSFEMASAKIRGLMRKKFPMTATVDITGNPTITPGGVVRIEKYGTQFDGFWYVRAVRHEINRSELISTLDLAKDSIDDGKVLTTTTAPYPPTIEPVLVNKVWVSSRNYSEVY